MRADIQNAETPRLPVALIKQCLGQEKALGVPLQIGFIGLAIGFHPGDVVSACDHACRLLSERNAKE